MEKINNQMGSSNIKLFNERGWSGSNLSIVACVGYKLSFVTVWDNN